MGNNTRERIIFLISSSIAGGGQIYLYNIIEYIQDHFSVLVICPNGYLSERIMSLHKVDIENMDINYKTISKIRAIILVEVKKYRNISINAHLLGTALWTCLALSNIPKIRFVVTIHNKVIYDGISIIKRLSLPFIIRYLSKKADDFIGVSQEITDSIEQITGKKFKYIPSSVPITSAPKNIKYYNCNQHEIIVGFVGRLSKLKNPIRFIEAAALVHKRIPNTIFHIIGDGELRKKCEIRVAELGLLDVVKFLGFIQDSQSVMRKLDILAISSNSEGTPLVLLEAMSMGIPVVATRVGAIPLVIQQKVNGLLATQCTSEGLASEIVMVLTDIELYKKVAYNGYKTINEQFNYARNLNIYINVLLGR